MSGFEVAGIVLATLPLVISALEHYANGVNTIRRYRHYHLELKSMSLQIQTESGIFLNTMEQLLAGIVKIADMNECVSNPGGISWRTTEVDMRLKDRLRKVYDVYFDNVKGMAASLDAIRAKLALNPDGEVQSTDVSAFKKEYKRLKFCLSKADYDEHVEKLKNHNSALSRLTEQSLHLEPSRTRAKLSAPNFKALQNLAHVLFEALRSGLQCMNGGCPNHAVNLRLEHRDATSPRGDLSSADAPFRVVFKHTHAARSRWDEAMICRFEDTLKTTPLQPSTSGANTNTQKRARFAHISYPSQKASGSQSTTTVLIRGPTAPVPPPVPHIDSLCKAMEQLQLAQGDTCVGYIIDPEKQRMGLYSLTQRTSSSQDQWAAYSLRQIIKRQVNVGRRLTQLDKLRTAVHLSASILHLYKTPWLDENWSGEDVFFLRRPGAPSITTFEYPYVYRKLTLNTAIPSLPNKDTEYGVVRNQTLFNLGVLLIELWYGRTIEELQEPEDLNFQGTPGVTWCTAVRIVTNELEFDAGESYSRAVRRCVRCDFDCNNTSLEDDVFQQVFFDKVVAPLRTTLQLFSGQLT